MFKKFAILGLGHIGKAHFNAIQQVDEAQLTAIIDSVEVNKKEVNIFSSLDEFITADKNETDVVIIATPNGLHAEHAIQCLKNGYHILVEKPLALTYQSAQEIEKVAQENDKRVFNTLQLRFSPVVQQVKALIEQGDLGQIFMANAHCYWNRGTQYYKQRKWHGTQQMDGGVLFTQFSHFVDILFYWFGELELTNAQSYNFTHQGITEFPDSGKFDFTTKNGTIGNMIYTTATQPKNFSSGITLLTEKGTLQVNDQYLNHYSYFSVENQEAIVADSEHKVFHPDAIQEVVEALSQNRTSILDGKNALPVVRFIEKVSK